MKIRQYLRVSVGALAIAGLFVVACSDDSTGSTGATDAGRDGTADTGAPDTSTGPTDSGLDTSKPDVSQPGVTVTVTYAGTKTGSLTVSLFAGGTPPPVPPPAALANVTNPVYPVTTRKLIVAPGTYLVTGYIDVGGNNPAGPGAEDPRQVAFKTVTFAGADVSADLVMGDPD